MPLYYPSGEVQHLFKRVILNLDKETGISVMKIALNLILAPVMMQSKVSISRMKTMII